MKNLGVALLTTVFMVVLLGPAADACLRLPHHLLDAWPTMALALFPAAAMPLATIVYHLWRPRLEPPLASTASEWLRAEVARTGKVGITVAALARDENHQSFYHHHSVTIVLGEHVLGDHAARSHATAAHELGHAIVHLERPLLSRVTHAARAHGDDVFAAGAGLLLGGWVAGVRTFAIPAVLLLAAAMVLEALVVVDEALATADARVRLRPHLDDPAQVRSARNHLRRALATYGLRLTATIAAFALGTWLAATPHPALLDPGPPLSPGAHRVASALAAVTVAGVLGAALRLLRPSRRLVSGASLLAPVLSLCWSPLLFALLCRRPHAPAWTLALAAVPAWSVLAVVPRTAIDLVGGLATRGLQDAASTMQTRRIDIRRDALERLRSAAPDAGTVERLLAVAGACWQLPVALWWLM
ncbi:MAG TPA: hypothetical protein VHE35_22540 [Kofleriaceae bacterium]|nr:hypothetical protein [Kofleriaceae bacterium]